MTDTTRKVAIFGAVTAIAAVLGVLYFIWATNRVNADIAEREDRAAEDVAEFLADRIPPTREVEPEPTVDPGTGPVAQPGEVIVVHRVPGDDYGRLAIRHANGERTLLDRRCVRVDVSSGVGLCLSEDDGPLPSWTATVFDATVASLPEIRSHKMPLPSRARVSHDGTVAAATGFISGASYEDITSDSSTIVTVIPTSAGPQLSGLNQFEVDGAESRYAIDDRKFWGVSFIDNDAFYVTGLFGGDQPEILTGSIATRTLKPTGLVGSCPSLSPDGKTLVYKDMRAGGFQLIALDLASGDTWDLGETRPVDDQVEWLDNETILYALHPEEDEDVAVQPQFDIWSLAIAAGSVPETFLPAADSPTVIN